MSPHKRAGVVPPGGPPTPKPKRRKFSAHDVHENYAPDWETPPDWIEWARATMGGIDCDPCAAQFAGFADVNYVGTDGGGDDGLVMPWGKRTYVNPPGSNSVQSVKPWWARGVEQLNDGTVDALVWCFFNNEHVRHLWPSPLLLPGWMVMPVERVQYWRDGKATRGARNWSWFWSSVPPCRDPDILPITSMIVPTGPNEIVQLRGAPCP